MLGYFISLPPRGRPGIIGFGRTFVPRARKSGAKVLIFAQTATAAFMFSLIIYGNLTILRLPIISTCQFQHVMRPLRRLRALRSPPLRCRRVGKPSQVLQSRDRASGSHCRLCKAATGRREAIAGSAKPRPSAEKPLQTLQSCDRAPGSHRSHCRASPPRRDAITSSAQPRSRLRLHSQNKAPQTDIFDPIAPQKQANRKISTQNGTTIRGKSVSLRRCSPAPMPASQTGAGWDRTYW